MFSSNSNSCYDGFSFQISQLLLFDYINCLNLCKSSRNICKSYALI